MNTLLLCTVCYDDVKPSSHSDDDETVSLLSVFNNNNNNNQGANYKKNLKIILRCDNNLR